MKDVVRGLNKRSSHRRPGPMFFRATTLFTSPHLTSDLTLRRSNKTPSDERQHHSFSRRCSGLPLSVFEVSAVQEFFWTTVITKMVGAKPTVKSEDSDFLLTKPLSGTRIICISSEHCAKGLRRKFDRQEGSINVNHQCESCLRRMVTFCPRFSTACSTAHPR